MQQDKRERRPANILGSAFVPVCGGARSADTEARL